MDTDLLKTLIQEIIKEIATPKKKLYVIDFDDTLVKMDSKIRIKKTDGTKLVLTPADYAVYEKEPDDVFDFSDFRGEKLINPKEITWMTKILRRVISKRGTDGAVILTARPKDGTPQIKTFFEKIKLPLIPIVALGDSDPYAKAQWILMVAKQHRYDSIEFFDDSYKNIEAVNSIADQVPETKIVARLVKNRKF